MQEVELKTCPFCGGQAVIKAKTKEMLDAVGEKLAIEAQAIVLLEKI
mgnify:CR=1 FL=1